MPPSLLALLKIPRNKTTVLPIRRLWWVLYLRYGKNDVRTIGTGRTLVDTPHVRNPEKYPDY